MVQALSLVSALAANRKTTTVHQLRRVLLILPPCSIEGFKLQNNTSSLYRPAMWALAEGRFLVGRSTNCKSPLVVFWRHIRNLTFVMIVPSGWTCAGGVWFVTQQSTSHLKFSGTGHSTVLHFNLSISLDDYSRYADNHRCHQCVSRQMQYQANKEDRRSVLVFFVFSFLFFFSSPLSPWRLNDPTACATKVWGMEQQQQGEKGGGGDGRGQEGDEGQEDYGSVLQCQTALLISVH